MKKQLFLAIGMLTLSSLACSFTVNLPNVDTIPETTAAIDESVPSGIEDVVLRLDIGAAEVEIGSGAKNLVNGTVTYNVAGWEPKVNWDGDELTIKQETQGIKGLPSTKITNQWDLQLGGSVPTSLIINAGAYSGKMELGGLPLNSLSIEDGASTNTVQFSSPNTTPMERFSYNTGASTITLKNLANANFAEMNFSGGAGSYELDFSGELQRDAEVDIEAGVSTIRIVVPEGTSTEIKVNGEMKNVNTSGTWTVNGSRYSTEGSGPLLEINVNMNLGSLELVRE
jgi:hypothetical protein